MKPPLVSESNSLVGSHTNDYVGGFYDDFNGDFQLQHPAIAVLSNGNYVVASPSWANGLAVRAGAVTWGSGSTGVRGAVSSSNSLIGSQANDQVGSAGGAISSAVTALSNGNYVVASPFWANGSVSKVGAVTWSDGSNGVVGAVSSDNSLVGSRANDGVGSIVTALRNGDYLVSSIAWANGAASNAGALTLGNGRQGLIGAVSSSNSLVGTQSNDYLGLGGALALSDGSVLVKSTYWSSRTGRVDVLSASPEPGSVPMAYADNVGGKSFVTPAQITALTNSGTDVVLQASNDLTVASPVIYRNPNGDTGSLTLQAGRSVLINASINTGDGNLRVYANDLLANGVVDADRAPGAAVVTMGSGASIDAGKGSVGIVLRTGAGLTNSTSGDITLRDISGGAINIDNRNGGGVVLADGALTASGTGNSLLVRGASFTNDAGANALVANNGRWLVFSSTPVADTFGGLQSGNTALWGRPLSTASSAVDEAGNRFVFSDVGAITVTSTNAPSKSYGSVGADLTLNYNFSGAPVEAAPGNAYQPATASDIFYNAPSITSRGSAATANVGSYAVEASGAVPRSGYSFSYANTGTLTVNPFVVNLAGSRVYDGGTDVAAAALSTGPLVGTETLALRGSGSVVSKNAGGGQALTLGSLALADGGNGGLASNYTLVGGTHTLDITPKPVTVTGITVASKTYDGTSTASLNTAAAILDGKVSLDDLTLIGATGSFADKNAGSGKTVRVTGISLGGADAANYTLASNAASLTADIGRASVSAVTGITVVGKTYDGTTAATLDTSAAGFAGMLNGDALTAVGAIGSFADKNAGSGKTVDIRNISLGGLDAVNYTLASSTASATADIAKANATVTANSGTATYDTHFHTVSGFTVSGLVNGETAAVLTSVKATGVSENNAGTYITAASGSDGNYNLSFANGSLVIDKAKATVIANSLRTVYNGQVQNVNGFSATGLGSDETAAVLTGVSVTGASGTNAGTYVTVASGSDRNYDLSFVNGSLVIAPRPVTVAADAKEKATSVPDPALTYATGCGTATGNCGLVAGESLAGALSRSPGSEAGKHAILQGTVTDASNPNYRIAYVGADLTIASSIPQLTAMSQTQKGGQPKPLAVPSTPQAPSTSKGTATSPTAVGLLRISDDDINW